MSSSAAKDLDAGYWQALAEGGLAIQRCEGCRKWHWPAVSRCADCGAWSPPWQQVALEGEVFSWATTHHAFGGTESLGVPYTTVLVALPHAGDKRLLGVFEGDPAMLVPGLRVVASVGSTPVRGKPVASLRWRVAEGA